MTFSRLLMKTFREAALQSAVHHRNRAKPQNQVSRRNRNDGAQFAASAGVYVSSFITRATLPAADDLISMRNYAKILFSILASVICLTAFAADQPECKKTGKNCPMNDGKACNCGKSCSC